MRASRLRMRLCVRSSLNRLKDREPLPSASSLFPSEGVLRCSVGMSGRPVGAPMRKSQWCQARNRDLLQLRTFDVRRVLANAREGPCDPVPRYLLLPAVRCPMQPPSRQGGRATEKLVHRVFPFHSANLARVHCASRYSQSHRCKHQEFPALRQHY